MNRLLRTLIALRLLLSMATPGNASQTCPSESRSQSGYGKRMDAESCLTLVFRDELMKQGNMSHIKLPDRAAAYCREFFKNGTLVMYVGTMLALKELEGLDATQVKPLVNNRGRWNSFLCFHQPYKDCEERTDKDCVYDGASNSCVWQYTYHEIQSAEPPYGNPCPSFYDLVKERKACSCQRCSKTEWTQWKEYVDTEGNRFRIHYRPSDNKPCHNCYADTSACCSEYEIIGKNHTERIQCFNGATKLNSTNRTCACPANATGEFCEITTAPDAGTQSSTRKLYDVASMRETFMKWLIVFLLTIVGLMALCAPFVQYGCHRKPVILIRGPAKARMSVTHAEIETGSSPVREARLMEAAICIPSSPNKRRSSKSQRSTKVEKRRTASRIMTTKEQEITVKGGQENCGSVSIAATAGIRRRQRANRRRQLLLRQRKLRMRRAFPRRRSRSQRRFHHYSE